MMFDGTGNIGIGTETPVSLLELRQPGASGLTFSRIDKPHDTYELLLGGEKGLHIRNRTNSNRVEMMFDGTGNIGIGTEDPESLLELRQSGPSGLTFSRDSHDSYELLVAGRQGLYIKNKAIGENGRVEMMFDGTGKVAIGTTETTNGNYKLYVKDGIRTEKVKVDVSSNWADFVFEEDYQLRSLEEVEAFVKENKHLPEIPSATEVEKEGIDLGEMNAKLLQKIEELTLYVIEQDKRLKALEEENKKLKTHE